VKPSRASHDFASANRSAALALDGRIDTGWSIGPRTGEAAPGRLRDAESARRADRHEASLRLVSQYVHQTTIGRFRISVTTDPKPADG
jgi:hypothetical protein